MNKQKLLFIFYTLVYSATTLTNAIDAQTKTYITTDSLLSVESIQKAMQDPYFALEILPNDFSYLSGLLTFGKNTPQPVVYARSVFKLFGNTIKASEYINAYAFSELLTQLNSVLEPYINQVQNKNGLIEYELFQQEVNTLLHDSFKNEYHAFKTDPTAFLQGISGSIALNAHQELTIDQLRMQITRFLELALSKLVWSPEECEESWKLVKKMTNDLAQLFEKNIIADINDLDDIYWSLVYQYGYFLRICTDLISDTFYRDVRNDINTNQLALFNLDVANGGITESKFAHLNSILFESEMHSKAHAKAVEKGVLVT